MSPERTNLVLTTDVPNVEFDVLVGYSFDVEADGGDGGYVGIELELVQNCYAQNVSIGKKGKLDCSNGILVFPAASKPSMSRRISLEPKSLLMIFEAAPPMVDGVKRRIAL